MMVAYNTVFRLTRASEYDTSPNFHVGLSGGSALVSMEADNFDIKHKEGKASVTLARHFSVSELKMLAAVCLDAARELDNNRQWCPSDVGQTADGQSMTIKVKPNNG